MTLREHIQSIDDKTASMGDFRMRLRWLAVALDAGADAWWVRDRLTQYVTDGLREAYRGEIGWYEEMHRVIAMRPQIERQGD